MARGAPDYTKRVQFVELENPFGYPIAVGNSELAARLGSPVTYERRGYVYLVDSFEHGLNKCQTGYNGTGGGVALDQTWAKTGDFSAKLTTGSDGLLKAQLLYKLAPLPTGRPVGVEFSWSIEDKINNVTLFVYIYDGSNCIQFGARYQYTSWKIQIYGPDTAWHQVGSLFQALAEQPLFYPMKLVVDPAIPQYLRLFLAATEIDLTGQTPRTFGASLPPMVWVEIDAYGTAGYNAAAWVDDVIVTLMEETD